MAISESQKVDYLWKKLGYSASKTDTNTLKKAPNEAIASPLVVRADKVMKQSASIPATKPTSSVGVVTIYNVHECTMDATATTNRTWKTGQTDWISPEFGSTYQVKVYVHDSGDAANAADISNQVFATGSGNDDEWFFDYQSGVLYFIGENLPNGVDFAGKSVYITGARYTGDFGVGDDLGDFTFSGSDLSTTDGGAIIFDVNTGIVLPIGTTAERSSVPEQGEIRFNVTNDSVEVYNGAEWVAIGGGVQTFDYEQFEGDGVTTTFTLKRETTSESVLIVTGGIVQMPGTGYQINGDQITFAEAPIDDDEVIIRYVASSATVTGVRSPDTNNNIDCQNDDITLDMNGVDILTATSAGVDIVGDVSITGDITIGGNMTLGDANTDSISLSADLSSDLIPSVGDTYDIGTPAKQWKDLYMSGSIYVDGTAITATPAELNILDGATVTASELNVLDGATVTASELNLLDGTTLTQNEVCLADPTGTFITTTDAITIDQINKRIGVGTNNPEVKLHISGSSSQEAQVRMEQCDNSIDAPDIRTRKGRGSIASPANIAANDYLFRLNTEARVSNTWTTVGSMAYDAVDTSGNIKWTISTRSGNSLAERLRVNSSGNVEVTGSLDVNSNKITSVATPTANTDAANKSYVDTAKSSAITSANSHTDTRETAITTAYQSYTDTAETNARAYTDTRETAITTAYQTYADQAETDANSYTDTAVANLVSSAPSTLDTLNELAAALGDDPNFATTVATDIGTKVAKTSNQALGTAANALTATDAIIRLARGDGTSDIVTVNNVANATNASKLDINGADINEACYLTWVKTSDLSSSYQSLNYRSEVKTTGTGTSTQLEAPFIYATNSLTSGTVFTQTINASNGSNLLLRNVNDSETYIQCTPNAEVMLYYNGVQKMATSSSGIIVAGTMTGTATSAQYADLAERYVADAEYPTGTVMAVGGDEEVTAATTATAHSVLGVISENPAYLMNKNLDGATVALKGRVPVRVEGQVNKGDRLAPSQTPGVATVDNTRTGWSFAIALESGTGIVEAVIL